MNDGKISRYASTISEMADVSATEKYFWLSPSVTYRFTYNVSSEAAPDNSAHGDRHAGSR